MFCFYIPVWGRFIPPGFKTSSFFHLILKYTLKGTWWLGIFFDFSKILSKATWHALSAPLWEYEYRWFDPHLLQVTFDSALTKKTWEDAKGQRLPGGIGDQTIDPHIPSLRSMVDRACHRSQSDAVTTGPGQPYILTIYRNYNWIAFWECRMWSVKLCEMNFSRVLFGGSRVFCLMQGCQCQFTQASSPNASLPTINPAR